MIILTSASKYWFSTSHLHDNSLPFTFEMCHYSKPTFTNWKRRSKHVQISTIHFSLWTQQKDKTLRKWREIFLRYKTQPFSNSNTIGAHSGWLVFKNRRRKKNTIPLKFISALNGKFFNIFLKNDLPKTFQKWPNFYLQMNCKLLPLFKLSFR